MTVPVPATAPAPREIDLRPLFAPRSIAVVGASPRGGLAQTLRDNLAVMGSETRIYLVNPKYEEIAGTRCWPTLDALPERPDTVLLAVNPLRAARFTQEAADAGIPSIVIPGGGVVEGGEAAAEMQRTVREIAIRHGIALLGPNCMGMVDWTTNTTNYIGDVNPWLPRGHVAGLAQSGSVTDAFIHAPGSRIGYSRIVSIGAEAVLDLCDYLAYCLDDPETHAVMLFVEGFKRPERFLALCDRALALGKPILAVKVGRSAQAQDAAIAHSGSLAGEDRVTDAALEAAGVIRCADLDELLEQAELVAGTGRLGRGGRPRADGRRDGVDGRGLAGRRPRGADGPGPAAGAGRRPRGDPRGPAHDGLHRQPAGPVGRGRRGPCLPRRVRGVRGVGRLRRAGDRPRQPVPRPALGGGRRADREHGADRGDPRPAGPAPGLRLAHRGRRQRAGQGHARRGGRHADAARRDGVDARDRAAGGVGGGASRAARRRAASRGLAGARRRARRVGLGRDPRPARAR